mgnify:CR=1 FL=1
MDKDRLLLPITVATSLVLPATTPDLVHKLVVSPAAMMLVLLVVASPASPVAMHRRLSTHRVVDPMLEVASLVDRVKPLHRVVASTSKVPETAAT